MTAWLELWRQTMRGVVRHPLYSAFAVVTLAVAIGGGTLVFSLYDAIAFRALPVESPHDLVSVREVSIDADGQTADFGRLSLADYEEMRDAAAPLADLGAYAEGEAVVRAGTRTEHVAMQWVDPRYFEILGVRTERGRTFAPDDDPRQGGSGGVVITDATWSRLFDRDPNVTRRTIDIDGVTEPVLGVAAAGFRGFEVGADPALFGLASQAPENWAFFRMLARLHPGTSAAQLETKLGAAHDAIRERDPNRQSFMIVDGKSSKATERIQVVDGSRGESHLRGDATLPIALVGGLLALVLIVLGANLANLLAVRALSERGSAAIRLALGAPRLVVAGGWLAESLLLTLCGAALGLAVIAGMGDRMLQWAPLPEWASGLSPTLDLRTIAVAFGLAIAVAVVVGSLAAWEQTRVTPQLRLREESTTTTQSRGRARWRNALIASQVALSVVLLVAMGLFVRSATALLDIDTGFPLERVLTFRLDVPESLADEASPKIELLREEIARMPGVVAAGFSTNPVLGGVRGYVIGAVEGYTPKDGEVMMMNTLAASPGFFESLKMKLASGRFFTGQDLGRATKSVIVNREFAKTYWGDTDPVGRRISFNMMRDDWSEPQPDDLIVVGVVDDQMISDVREKPTPRIYPLATGSTAAVTFYVRTPSDPMRLAASVDRLARERIPEAAAGTPRTLEDQRDRSLRRELLTRDLTLVFGALAAALAALGLFAVLSYLVGERRREYGLRQALGAQPNDLLRHVLADGLRPVVWGLAAGLAIATGLVRFAASQLYGVSPRDPVAFVTAVTLMAIVALIACIPAALRASRTDPAQALRE